MPKNIPYPDGPLARFDWKAMPEDILYSLRDAFGEAYPFLLEQSFDDLEENVSGEPTLEAVRAFGQEATLHGMALVSIDEGNDAYCIALIPHEQYKEFSRAVKKAAGYATELVRQSNKKPGSAAKRIDLSRRLVFEDCVLTDGGRDGGWEFRTFMPGSRYALRRRTKGEEVTVSWLDTASWPPEPRPCSRTVREIAYGEACCCWAISLDRPELRGTPEEYLPSKYRRIDDKIYLTPNPVDETTWREVPFPAGCEAAECDLFFLGQDLFFGQKQGEEHGVWVLRDAASFISHSGASGPVPSGSWRHLFRYAFPEGDRRGLLSRAPEVVRTGDGAPYITAGGRLWSWRDGECRQVEGVIRPGQAGTVPGGAHSFLYVDWEGRLIELDLQSGQERFRSLGFGKTELCCLAGGWTAITRWGHITSKEPIALFWHKERDEWLTLYFGALGKEIIRHMEMRPDGSVLMETNIHRFCRIADLIPQVRALMGKRKGWPVGEWSDDPAEGSDEWFEPAMEAELGLTGIRGIRVPGDGSAMFSADQGIFMANPASGLWNKLHAARKAERPAHQSKTFGDGTFDYTVYKMDGLNDLKLYRAYPPVEGENKPGGNAGSGGEVVTATSGTPETEAEDAEPTNAGAPPSLLAKIITLPIAVVILAVASVIGLVRLAGRALKRK